MVDNGKGCMTTEVWRKVLCASWRSWMIVWLCRSRWLIFGTGGLRITWALFLICRFSPPDFQSPRWEMCVTKLNRQGSHDTVAVPTTCISWVADNTVDTMCWCPQLKVLDAQYHVHEIRRQQLEADQSQDLRPEMCSTNGRLDDLGSKEVARPM